MLIEAFRNHLTGRNNRLHDVRRIRARTDLTQIRAKAFFRFINAVAFGAPRSLRVPEKDLSTKWAPLRRDGEDILGGDLRISLLKRDRRCRNDVIDHAPRIAVIGIAPKRNGPLIKRSRIEDECGTFIDRSGERLSFKLGR